MNINIMKMTRKDFMILAHIRKKPGILTSELCDALGYERDNPSYPPEQKIYTNLRKMQYDGLITGKRIKTNCTINRNDKHSVYKVNRYPTAWNITNAGSSTIDEYFSGGD